MELNAMRKFLNITVLIYVNSNYFSPSRLVLKQGSICEMYGYCKSWKTYEDLDTTGSSKRFWDDGVKEGLEDILTLQQEVLLKMQMEDETENRDKNAPKNSDNAEPKNIDNDEPEQGANDEPGNSDKENCPKDETEHSANDETENSDKENSDK